MREKPGEGVREMSKRKKLNCRKIVKMVLEKTAGMRRRTMRLREAAEGIFADIVCEQG